MSTKTIADAVSPPLEELAEVYGVPTQHLYVMKHRGQPVPAAVREQVASYMRERAKLLQAAADELEAGE